MARWRQLVCLACLFHRITATVAGEYEGLVLMKRYAASAAAHDGCAKDILAPMHPDLPTSRGVDVVQRVLAVNGSAVVFDFEGPSLGIGNCLFGFLQAFHWAVLGGMPLFLLSHPKGTANALCSVFDCGFPIVSSELVSRLGSHRYPASPKDKHFRELLSFRNEGPFKVGVHLLLGFAILVLPIATKTSHHGVTCLRRRWCASEATWGPPLA